MTGVIPFERAIALVAEQCRLAEPRGAGSVPLEHADARVLAADVCADRDQPPFHRSTRDGYAVRAADSQKPLRVLGQVRAGAVWDGGEIGTDECVEIMTGAPVPVGAGAVVMLEHVSREGDAVRLLPGRTIASGDNVVARGAEAHAGDTVLRAGVRLNAVRIGAAAAAGCATLQVFAKPVVSVLSTGDELVAIDEQPAPHQIRNSNTPALAAAVSRCGGDARMQPVARDTRESLRERIAAALPCDLLLMSGGVSAGSFDLVEPVLAEDFGAEFFFTGVAMQPGRPVVFGRLAKEHGGAWFFGLPGNPLSALVTFTLFARPLLLALSGETESAPPFRIAQVEHDISMPPGLTRFLPAITRWQSDRETVRRVTWQGSGDTTAGGAANGYVVVPEAGVVAAGEWVRVLASF